jgi:hypothetical protein
MAIKKDASQPIKGMNRDAYHANLTQEEYSFALNANIQEGNGNVTVIQNETSNLKCTLFKEGFRVIGHKFDNVSGKTFFFLTNPTTGCSEIGYIDTYASIDGLEPLAKVCKCHVTAIPDTPLEDVDQEWSCEYHTLISDFCELTQTCTGCLNFSINHPIKETNIQIKSEKTGKNLYWTDNYNAQRYLQLDNLSQYNYSIDDCSNETIRTCLKCDKLDIFKKFEKPCLTPVVLQNGGALNAGFIEVLIAYSNSTGEGISNYYSLTNPIPIWDENNPILDQTTLDYQTSQAVKIRVDRVDDSYEYFKIVVVYRSGLDGAQRMYDYGVYPIDTKEVTISSLKNKSEVKDVNGGFALQTLLGQKPFYTHSKGMAAANGYLFQYGLKRHRDINLQKVVSLMGGFVTWSTMRAEESLYKNGVYVSNYKSYMRDETYPLAIKFFSDGGYTTSLFPFVPRPPKASEIEVLGTTAFPENLNTNSINKFSPDCYALGRDKRWQYENTATEEGVCPVQGASGNTESVTREEEFPCTVMNGANPKVVDIIASSFLYVDSASNLDIVSYINTNASEIIASTGTNGQDIRDILSDPSSYPDSCTPNLGSNCTNETLESEEMFAISVENSLIVQEELPLANYVRAKTPSACSSYTADSSGNTTRDTTFETAYMPTGSKVYKRTAAPANISCDTAIQLVNLVSPQIDNQNYLMYFGSDVVTNLQTTVPVTVTGTGFSSFLHKGAIWFKVVFGTDTKVFVDISKTSCTLDDDNATNKLRISVFADCDVTSYLASYSSIISDISLANNPATFLELDVTDFPTGTGYIALDAQIYPRINPAGARYTTTPPCGCFSIYKVPEKYRTKYTYDNLRFGKKQIWKADCTFDILKLDGCDPVPYKYGLFSYVESTETYPCNNELWNSSTLTIAPSDLPTDIQSTFEDYYASGFDIKGNYILNSETNLMDKPIKHYKFPDNSVAPFISTSDEKPGAFMDSVISPIGFFISNDVINAFLDVAVKNNLITAKERASIKSYEIFRGDRSTNKSIIAKGLLFDMYAYPQNNKTIYYPNYPLNSLGWDVANEVLFHPKNSIQNNLFTFHSPDTHFYRPSLYREMNVEAYMFGNAGLYFDEVLDHATFTILGNKAYDTADALALAEISFEILLQTAEWSIGATNGDYISSIVGIAIAVGFVITLGIQAYMKYGEYRYKWEKVFSDVGKPQNFAYYSVAVGHYNYLDTNNIPDSKYRGLNAATYLKQGRWNVIDESSNSSLDINNFQREESVFLNLGAGFDITYPTVYRDYDNATSNANNTSRSFWAGTGRSSRIQKNAASPYVSIKQFLPSQYGQIHDIDWVHTGYCGYLDEDNTCKTIFGGDTFISRFSLKRKFPFFTSTAHGMAPLTPFKYSDYFNVNPEFNLGNRYYIDYLISDYEFSNSYTYPEIKSNYTLYKQDASGWYVKPPSKFFLYSYGIPYFLVESEINSNFRYGKKEKHENFYPNISDVIEFTQESNVSIREPNTFYYNFIYSQRPTVYFWDVLPSNYSEEIQSRVNNLTNSLIYSRQDNTETNLTDPWLIYKGNDLIEFPTAYGELVDISGIESQQLLARFENGFAILNAVDVLAERVSKETGVMGSGGMFAGRPISFNQTDLGYAGTQHATKVSTEFGHFWVDAKRGGVFMVNPNAKDMGEVTTGLEHWFKENLPFKILKEYPDVDIDNNYNGVGIAMGWDNRLKRVFLTKKDYTPINTADLCFSNGYFHSRKEIASIQQTQTALGYTFVSLIDCVLRFAKLNTPDLYIELPKVDLSNPDYFEDHSWTVGYSPLTKTWISYYSFKPNYYVNHIEYFQTGINHSVDSSEVGLWSHYALTSSYNVFYGKLYPWIVEYPQVSKLVNSQLIDVNYWLDVRKYYNKYDSADIVGVGFNKAWIYNTQQNTGDIELVYHQPNNRRLSLQYPKHNQTSISILQTEIHGEWNFNYLYNNIRNEKNALPVWQYDNVQINKIINHQLMDYRNARKDRMRGDYFIVRLQQDVESRYKMLFRFASDKRNFKDYQ